MVNFIFSTKNGQKYIGTGSGTSNGVSQGTVIKGRLLVPKISALYGINDFAFSYQEKLYEVIIEASITEIRSEAFIGCGRISRIFLPKTLTSIGEDAFNLYLANPTRLGDGTASVFISSTSPLTLARAAFCWKEYFSMYYCGNSYATSNGDLYAFSKSAVLESSKYVYSFTGLTAKVINSSLDCSYHRSISKKPNPFKKRVIKMILY